MKIKEAVETLYSYGVEYEDINEATDTLLTAYEKEKREKEKRENQKKELAILNTKQTEFNKLVNTVNSYKGQFKRQQKEIEELKDFITKLQATKDRLDSYDKENTLEIEKLNKEIEELKEKNRQSKMRIVQLENEITARIEDVNQYYTPNDKIKAKIEEVDIQLQKLKDGLTGRKTNFVNKNMLFAQKEVLQSLLEKE